MSAQLQQLLSYLDREGVSELVIATSRSIAMRQNGKYVNLTARPMTLEMVTTLLDGTPISPLVPTSDASPPPSDVEVGERRLRVRTGRRGDEVVVRLEAAPKVSRTATRSRRRPPPQLSSLSKDKPPAIVERMATGRRARTSSSNVPVGKPLLPEVEIAVEPLLPEVEIAVEPLLSNAEIERESPPRKAAVALEPLSSKADNATPLLPFDEVSLPPALPDLSSSSTFELELPSVSISSFELELDPLPVSEWGEAPPPQMAPAPSPIATQAAAQSPSPVAAKSSSLAAKPPSEPSPSPLLQTPPPSLAATLSPASSLSPPSPSQLQPSSPSPPPPLQPSPPPSSPPPASPSLPPQAGPRPALAPPKTPFAKIVAAARAVGACDLHISAGRVVSVRKNAELMPLDPRAAPISADEANNLLLPLLGSEHEMRLQTVGYVDLAIEAPGGGRLRANISRHQVGLKGTFRLAIANPKPLDELGLPKDVAKVVHHHQGFVVIAGPSGHGKTTTLAALVDLVNSTKAAHILLVEDPIEIEHPRKMSVISQREAGRHTKSFASALKASLREDPDVIVIGELRDRETVEIALTASETGHLVIATMSTPSAAKTLDRLIDMFPPEDHSQVRASVAGALRAIVAQRLLPAVGGGVVPAIEVVTGVLPLAALIRDDKLYQLPNVMQRGRAFGMIRFDDSLAELVRAGKITEDTAFAVAQDRKDLASRLKKGA